MKLYCYRVLVKPLSELNKELASLIIISRFSNTSEALRDLKLHKFSSTWWLDNTITDCLYVGEIWYNSQENK